jgi:hypothetical protein
MKTATRLRFAHLERLILSLHTTLNLRLDSFMITFEDYQAKIDELNAAAIEAKADATRQAVQTEAAVGLLQALSAKIGDLVAQGAGAITQAQLDALGAQVSTALTDLADANAARDAADATLAAGVAENTPPSPV